MGFSGPFFTWNFPWRPPNLPRLVRTAEFRAVRAAADDWIERQFDHVRANVGALDPAARSVCDYGVLRGTSWRWHRDFGILRIRFGAFATLGFTRQVAVTYGCDGPSVADHVLDLSRALERAGWRMRLNPRTDRGGPLPMSGISPADSAATGTFAGQTDQPPHLAFPQDRAASCLIRLVWTSRADPSRSAVEVTLPARPETRKPESMFLPLELLAPLPPADILTFAAPALAEHQHAVVMLIEHIYYQVPPGRTRPRSIPRRLLPRLT